MFQDPLGSQDPPTGPHSHKSKVLCLLDLFIDSVLSNANHSSLTHEDTEYAQSITINYHISHCILTSSRTTTAVVTVLARRNRSTGICDEPVKAGKFG